MNSQAIIWRSTINSYTQLYEHKIFTGCNKSAKVAVSANSTANVERIGTKSVMNISSDLDEVRKQSELQENRTNKSFPEVEDRALSIIKKLLNLQALVITFSAAAMMTYGRFNTLFGKL